MKQTRTGFALTKRGLSHGFRPNPLSAIVSVGSLGAPHRRCRHVCPRAPICEANRNQPLPLRNMAAPAFAFTGGLSLPAPVAHPTSSPARSSHGGHEPAAAGFGRRADSAVWPPCWHQARSREFSHTELPEDCRWVQALETRVRGGEGCFQVTLGASEGGSRDRVGLGLLERARAPTV